MARGAKLLGDEKIELRARQLQMKILLWGIFPCDAQSGTLMHKINSDIRKVISGYVDDKNLFWRNCT